MSLISLAAADLPTARLLRNQQRARLACSNLHIARAAQIATPRRSFLLRNSHFQQPRACPA
jgi:hypothetical protein